MIGVKLAGHRQGRWWPQGAVFAADFTNDRYMRAGVNVSRDEALGFARATAGWAQDGAATLHAFAENRMRRTSRGLVLESERTRLSPAPLDIAGSRWANFGVPGFSALPAEGDFSSPCRIWSPAGTAWERRVTATIPLVLGQPVHLRVQYRKGTSPGFGMYMRPELGGAPSSACSGDAGNLSPQSATVGAWSAVVNTALGGNLHQVEADFIPNQTEAYRFGVSANSATPDHHVDVLGAMLVRGAGSCEWILGNPAGTFLRGADLLTLRLPAAGHDLEIRFADDSTRTISDVPANYVIDPASLPARRISSIFST